MSANVDVVPDGKGLNNLQHFCHTNPVWDNEKGDISVANYTSKDTSNMGSQAKISKSVIIRSQYITQKVGDKITPWRVPLRILKELEQESAHFTEAFWFR